MTQANSSDLDAHVLEYFQKWVKWVSLHSQRREKRKGNSGSEQGDKDIRAWQDAIFR